MATTPMLQQFLKLKQENPDCILFFRLGDFYETFYEDATIASRELGIVLTGRDAGDGARAPMAGVPHHSVHSYLQKLVLRGYKVAICEQMEDPRLVKGLVKRDVVRIVTPGTITDERMLDEKANNFIAAVVFEDGYGLAAADVSTGQFFAMEFAEGRPAWKRVADEVKRISASECLVDAFSRDEIAGALGGTVKTFTLAPHVPNDTEARAMLLRHFRVKSLHGFGCEDTILAVRAAAALLAYLNETQRGVLSQIVSMSTRSSENTLVMDADTRRNLELTRRISDGSTQGSLLGVIDRTSTAMGARALRQLIQAPYRDAGVISERLLGVSEITSNTLLRHDLIAVLKQVRDIERLVARVAGGTAGARELCALRQSLFVLPNICSILDYAESPVLKRLSAEIPELSSLWTLLDRAIIDDPPIGIKEGGIIKSGYDTRVDELRYASGSGKEWVASIEARERERSGIKNLKIGYNKVFGYYIEITNSNKELVPTDYIRKQTLSGAERYITPELKEYEDKILHAEERLGILEYEIFCRVRDEVAGYAKDLQVAARAVAEIDILVSFAEVAIANNYIKPDVNQGRTINIVDGRHPVVEQLLDSGSYVSNDVVLDAGANRLLLVTGPNMAGKSTYARSVALIVIMAQMGCFVPARSAEIGIADRVFARVGASDDVSLGRSTFMVEMTEVANILNNATDQSLVLLDEVGRGTGTYDGMSLAWAIAEDLTRNIRARTILTTHYHQLTELEETLPGTVNLRVSVKEQGEQVVFLHKIVMGKTDKSYGIQVARLAGVPHAVINRASEVLSEIDAEVSFRQARREAASAKSRRSPTNQMALLLPANVQSVLSVLKASDVDNMTPVQALQVMATLAKLAREE